MELTRFYTCLNGISWYGTGSLSPILVLQFQIIIRISVQFTMHSPDSACIIGQKRVCLNEYLLYLGNNPSLSSAHRPAYEYPAIHMLMTASKCIFVLKLHCITIVKSSYAEDLFGIICLHYRWVCNTQPFDRKSSWSIEMSRIFDRFNARHTSDITYISYIIYGMFWPINCHICE